jgi:putative Holliday junction resolvase
VESAMIAADMTRAKRAVRRDALAACWILQSALDAINDEASRNQATSTSIND